MDYSHLFALIKKSPQGHDYWLLDLENHTFQDFHNTKEERSLVTQHLIALVDAKHDLLSLSFTPSPDLRVICLATIKKLISRSVHESVSVPGFSSGDEALDWFKQALTTALHHIEKLQITPLADLECRVIVATMAMERAGLPFNKERWQSALKEFSKESQSLKNRLEKMLAKNDGFLLFGPEPVDLNNHHEVKDALEQVLGQKLKSTGQASLKDIDHEAAQLVVQYRECARMESTYGEIFLAKVDKRLRGNFTPISSASGRFSCHEVNLLALPNHPQFQACIEPEAGRTILHFDYGAFELRILAALSGDAALLQIFNKNLDIHSMVASAVFKTEVSKTSNVHLRDQAKVLNFGIIYGMGEHALARQLKISLSRAEALLKNYFAKFKTVREFLLSLEQHAKEYGYVKTALGRRGYMEGSETDAGYRSRLARNIPIQGTGADIVKLALCRVYQRLWALGLDAQVINLVHDELVVECAIEHKEKVCAVVTQEMKQAFSAILPNVAVEVGG